MMAMRILCLVLGLFALLGGVAAAIGMSLILGDVECGGEVMECEVADDSVAPVAIPVGISLVGVGLVALGSGRSAPEVQPGTSMAPPVPQPPAQQPGPWQVPPSPPTAG